MGRVGIVCEFDPFHLGHARLLTGEAERICLMSGYYVQRGHPAIFPREVRTRAALLGGADLVAELPVTVSLRSAEGFAAGAVALLARLGVDTLRFGSETGDRDRLLAAARTLLDPRLDPLLRESLARGVSFPAARAQAAEALGADPALLSRPNDILGLEYCKAILSQQLPMTPQPVQRPGDYHSREADPENPSATALRARIRAGQPWLSYVPEAARPAYAGAMVHSRTLGERAMLGRLRTMTEEEFAALPYGSEGLWRKLMHESRRQADLEAVLTAVKSKRYTRSRLDRMALCAFLGLTARDLEDLPPYVRILGFNGRGRKLLRQLRDQGVALVNAGERGPDGFREIEGRAASLYGLFGEQIEGPRREERVVILE